ncbi:enoyl-CoA hydratase/isomerase family protein [Antrihabitans cavernicola]|uniref:3-hydroxyisobutyryl-CoA hydrolase n=1 Tax=Antrihabitans cavernicola TaxID=2495913 RepID=A0A5A7SAA2_9NOCA|nr:enoyl-CoA hydratase/isomerase family protein [Spelaeibacter cavernicola]KAA0022414.1 enoyl-CoA hydratase/isomerase family protein [Spelaeibacter cavernicola]
MSEPEVLIDKNDGLGTITLNRPKAINALNHPMVQAITPALREWAVDDDVNAVVVTGSGERGLCAGGDIVSIYHDASGRAERGGNDAVGASGSAEFWREEYILNALIARFPKPYVAIMDGIVMGGGVGISAHGSVRIVTERSKIGMPEVGIGFVPDVGGTYLLARTPGELGTHVALTTTQMRAGDAIACGFADHYVPTSELPAFLDHVRTAGAQAAVDKFAQAAPDSDLLAQRSWIDECYSADTVEEIVSRLQAHSAPEANAAAEQILSKSPVSVKVALLSLRRARDAESIEEVLDDEYRVSLACLKSHDLVEGIRAQVIDKDRNPRWSPATLDAVSDEQVEAFFGDLGESELGLGAPATGLSEGQR